MDVLCVDKTGTITMNQLAVTGAIPLYYSTESDVLFAGVLASQQANQNPTDLAFLAAAREHHIFDAIPAVTAASFQPFDPQSRRTILKATNDNALFTFSFLPLLYLAVFSIVSANEQTRTPQAVQAKE
jgi:magnesium-transporting ATPase (P-type)